MAWHNINEILAKNEDLIKDKGDRAFKPLMGEVMKVLGRGSIDGKIISERLKEGLEKFSPEEKAEDAIKRLDNMMDDFLSENDVILKEKGTDAFDILFIKLKKLLKGQIEEDVLSEKLKKAIEVYLE